MEWVRELVVTLRGHPWILLFVLALGLGFGGYSFINTPCDTPIRLFGYDVLQKAKCENSGNITISGVDDKLTIFVNGIKLAENDGRGETISFAHYVRPGPNKLDLILGNGPGPWGLDVTVSADGIGPVSCLRRGNDPQNQTVVTVGMSIEADANGFITSIGPCE